MINTVCGSLYTLYHYFLIQKEEEGVLDSSYPIPKFIYLFALALTATTTFPYFRNVVLRYICDFNVLSSITTKIDSKNNIDRSFAKKIMRSQIDRIQNITFIKREVQLARTNNTGDEQLFERRTRARGKSQNQGITDEVVIVDL